MLRGLYTAVSGMETSQKKLDVISNNIANTNTSGFKKDLVVTETFPELLISKINGQLESKPHAREVDVQVERDGEAFRLNTGSGYFIAEGPQGKSYNSSSVFARDENGFLRTFVRDYEGRIDTSEGNYILDRQGERIQLEGGNLDVNSRGQLLVDGQEVADLLFRPGLGPKNNIIGTLNSGIGLDRIQTNFLQGGPEETGNTLDLAIEGSGFFRINTPDGQMYTRNGNFTLDSNGELVTKEGYHLLSLGGSILLDEDMRVEDLNISEEGTIYFGDEYFDEIDIVNIANVKDLRKYGQGYYRMEEGVEAQEEDFEGKILQGFLENSNVNPVEEMVDMITSLRLYESNQKVVQAYDDILQKAVNDIGRV